MKKLLFLFMVSFTIAITSFSQNEKYISAMQKNLPLFDSAKTVQDYTKLANTFERIGDAEKTQWAPYYYAGLALSNSGWTTQVDDKDANAERILSFCSKAESIAPDDIAKSEIEALRNMAATQQMLVNPQARWSTYGKAAGESLQKAMKLNPNNPRVYYLQGMSILGTPVQLGGGKGKAKSLFEKAIELYKIEKTVQLYPHWGHKQAEESLAQCQ